MLLSLIISLILIVITSKLILSHKLSSIYLLVSQIIASLIIIIFGNLKISFVNQIGLGYLSIPVSLLFLLSITNIMNMEQKQKPLILSLPVITLVCLSILGLIMDRLFISVIGIGVVITIMLVLLKVYITGDKKTVGRTFTTFVGFVIAVLSLSLSSFNFYIISIYIPVFTLALPLALYLFIQKKLSSIQSIIICSLVAIIFGLIMFVIPFGIEWYLVIGLTVILIISQFFSKYRFI